MNGSIYIEGGLIRNDVKKNNFSNILKFIFERYNSDRLILGSDPFNLTNIRKGGFEFAVNSNFSILKLVYKFYFFNRKLGIMMFDCGTHLPSVENNS